MRDTPKGLRLHIGLFGRRNVGKSSLLNALAGQPVSIVSDTPGTTTDPVEKTMEMAPLGPVVLLDTAGLDDAGALGGQRAARALQAMERADVAVVVTEHGVWDAFERELVARLRARNVPFFVAVNKTDDKAAAGNGSAGWAPGENRDGFLSDAAFTVLPVSARTGAGLEAVRRELARIAPEQALGHPPLVADLVTGQGIVVLVTPLDSGAPKGRLILPQVQTIRDALDGRKICLVVTEEEFVPALERLKEAPALVVCDSQVVRRVAGETPRDVPLTTFSILMARFKGDLAELAAGAARIRRLKPGDRVLVQEACSHHPQKDDIGRVKIPRLLNRVAGGGLVFDIVAGKAFTELTARYDLVVHCGGCAITRGQMLGRLAAARAAGVPMTNYGVAISCCQGVLERALAPFPEALAAYLAS